jgi:polyphosphate:AMP phosphotransferase
MAIATKPAKMPKRIYEARVSKLREDLVQMQVALKDAPFPLVLVIAGDDAAGKGEVVNLLSGWLDPRGTETHAFREPTDEERERPPMWRYWRTLPPRGRLAIYIGGWHADALAVGEQGRSGRKAFEARLEQLAHFEDLLALDGALIVKVWLRLPKKAQRDRLRALEADPDTAWRVTAEDWAHHRAYDRRARLAERMRKVTDSRRAPWQLVDAADPRARNLGVVTHLLRRFRAHQRAHARPQPMPKPGVVISLHPEGVQRLRELPIDQRLTEEEYEAKRDKWLGRLNHAVRAAAAAQRSIVWVFEGWDAAGKGGAIRRLTSAIDARDYRVIPVAKPTDEEKAHHYLWRFWRHIPRAGRVTIYDRSWYGRVLVERIEGFCREDEWRRAFGELNDFEAQLTAHGIIVLKFWLQVSAGEQLKRFRDREETPYKRHKINDEDWRNRRKWPAYEVAIGDMLALTDKPAAPWHLIAADNKRFARLEVLKLSCKQITAALGE